MSKYRILNFDYAQLYPTIMRDFSKDDKLMRELKRIRLRYLRIEKINKLNEKNN